MSAALMLVFCWSSLISYHTNVIHVYELQVETMSIKDDVDMGIRILSLGVFSGASLKLGDII